MTISGRKDVATELEALGDKSAKTLATSFERLLRSVATSIVPAPQPQAGRAVLEIWVIHILVGDGIPTNEAAAKLLLSCIEERELAPGTRYFLIVVKCATHQSGLSARSAVEGRAAAAAGGELYQIISGVTVRLFKYVICDYFEEFVASVREWLLQKLEVLPHEVVNVKSKNKILKKNPVCILIGPEGDFSKEEIKLSKNFGGVGVSIGNNILRTEKPIIHSLGE